MLEIVIRLTRGHQVIMPSEARRHPLGDTFMFTHATLASALRGNPLVWQD